MYIESALRMSSGPVFSASGLASGLDTASLIEQLISIERRPVTLMQERITKLNITKAQVENIAGRANTLLGTTNALIADSVLDENLFRAKQASVPESAESVLSVDVTESAAPQTLQVEVLQLATATRATGQSELGALATSASTISELAGGSFNDGDFTVFVDGVANTITVDTTQPLSDVLNQITAIGGGITGASVVDGAIQIDFTSGTVVQMGAQNDSSNFANIARLTTGTTTATSLTGSQPLTHLNVVADISDPSSGMATAVTDGTFTINGVEFDTTGKSLTDLVAEINNDASVGATVSINRTTNRFELKSTDTGSELVQLADGTGNFLTATGLIVAGNTTTSQTAGQNASFNLNGSLLYSTSNNVTNDITGIDGVTLNLESADVGNTIDITISRDSDPLTAKLKEFVSNINGVFSLINDQTDPQGNGYLKGESSMTRFKSDMRGLLSSAIDGLGLTEFTNLASIGISTGAVGATTGEGVVAVYSLDETRLESALNSNPAEVELLMTGTDGLLDRLQGLLEQATKDDPDPTEDGLFAGKTNSINDQVDSLNDRISSLERRLEIREQLLRQQFTQMERVYSQMQNQGSAISGLVSQLSANQ